MTSPVSRSEKKEMPQNDLRALDAEVAKALGATGRVTVYVWVDRKRRERPMLAFTDVPKGWGWDAPARRSYGSFVTEAGERCKQGVYFPAKLSSSLDAMASDEAEIERRGLGNGYARALCRELWPVHATHFDGLVLKFDAEAVSALLRATPEQRCRAALDALKAASTSPRAVKESSSHDGSEGA